MIYIDYDPEKAGSGAQTPTILSGVAKSEDGTPYTWSFELKPGRNVFDQNGGNKTAVLIRSHDNFDWYDEREAIRIDESDIDVTLESLRKEANKTVVVPIAVTNPVSVDGATFANAGDEGAVVITDDATPATPPINSPSSKVAKGKKLPEPQPES